MTTPEREARLEAFLVGDLEDAIEATMLAASSDHLTPDMRQHVNRALTLLQLSLGQQLNINPSVT